MERAAVLLDYSLICEVFSFISKLVLLSALWEIIIILYLKTFVNPEEAHIQKTNILMQDICCKLYLV